MGSAGEAVSCIWVRYTELWSPVWTQAWPKLGSMYLLPNPKLALGWPPEVGALTANEALRLTSL